MRDVVVDLVQKSERVVVPLESLGGSVVQVGMTSARVILRRARACGCAFLKVVRLEG